MRSIHLLGYGRKASISSCRLRPTAQLFLVNLKSARFASTVSSSEKTDGVASESNDYLDGEETRSPELQSPARLHQLPGVYMNLAKFRLGSLVAVSALHGFLMAPDMTFALASGSQLPLLAHTLAGTTLAIASANTFNQVIETDLDRRMKRTFNRVLPSGKISKTHAAVFGTVTGIAGTAWLATMVNPVAAGLAFSNILLYAGVYTPMKQRSALNTWVGSVVGAIPPLIGWVAVTGGPISSGAMSLAYLLFMWQIPHFLSLSYWRRDDYKRAGYQMMSTDNAAKVPMVSLFYCAWMLPYGLLTSYAELTNWSFTLTSLPLSAALFWHGYRFYSDTNSASAKKLFKTTLWYLPAVMTLMWLQKRYREKPVFSERDMLSEDSKFLGSESETEEDLVELIFKSQNRR